MKSILCVILIFWFFESKGQGNDKGIKLDYFDSKPTEIDGCEGDYTYDTTSLNKGKFILVTNIQKLAFIRVNGENIRLEIVEFIQLAKGKSKATYKGNGYIVVLKTGTIKVYDEGALEAGTFEISNGSNKVTIKVHGQSGC